MRSLPLTLGLLGATLPSALHAQSSFNAPPSLAGGVEVRRYSFEAGSPLKWVRQVALPVSVIIPIGRRFTVDLGTFYAYTTVRDSAGSESEFSHFTDTQLRGSYVFGRDAFVTTIMLNLPTGEQTTSLTPSGNNTIGTFGVSGAIASNFLSFPVNSYGSGFSATGGVAAATEAGGWNFGVAGSVRINSSYQPFSDTSQAAVKYRPGLEARVRVGADRLVGTSRLALGFTLSTFANDEFTTGGTKTGSFDPGNRYIGEASFTAPVGRGTLTLYTWDFYRANASQSVASNHENIFTAGASGYVQLGPRIGFEPLAESRFWSGQDRSGQLFGAGGSLKVALSPRLTFAPGGRYDLGSFKAPGQVTGSKTINGWALSGLIRYVF